MAIALAPQFSARSPPRTPQCPPGAQSSGRRLCWGQEGPLGQVQPLLGVVSHCLQGDLPCWDAWLLLMCHAVPCYAVPCHVGAVPCCAMPRRAMLHLVMLCRAMPCHVHPCGPARQLAQGNLRSHKNPEADPILAQPSIPPLHLRRSRLSCGHRGSPVVRGEVPAPGRELRASPGSGQQPEPCHAPCVTSPGNRFSRLESAGSGERRVLQPIPDLPGLLQAAGGSGAVPRCSGCPRKHRAREGNRGGCPQRGQVKQESPSCWRPSLAQGLGFEGEVFALRQ